MSKDISTALKSFKKCNVSSHPGDLNSVEEWHEIIDKMIFSFQTLASDNISLELHYEKEIQEGLDLFAKYFRHLWD